ncbi:PCRF domain-containing protein [Candidatus Shikimatogenerans bostrichidophilus]|uniref:PCRF domain-containing protein n=1 Tax=Candidatus Shikimatogenerans bostrichidophilus TaxID=2943807 RepID=UPI0029662602
MFINDERDIKITINNIKNIINIEKLKLLKLNKHKKIIKIYNSIMSINKNINLLNKLYENDHIKEEINIYKKKIYKLIEKFKKIIFTKKYKLNALIKINTGIGGKDCYNWVETLERMYIMWAKKNNFNYVIINSVKENNKKSSLIEIKNKYAYGYLQGEKGIHKLIRKSPFNKLNKRQTSYAYVNILPLIKKNNNIKIYYNDLIINTFRSSGAGGQNVNKVETGVRIKHIPSNITVECTKTRSQIINKKYAIKKLKYKLFKKLIDKKNKKEENLSHTRNYIMHPYKLIKDLKTGYKTKNIEKIINGNINEIIYNYINNYILNLIS